MLQVDSLLCRHARRHNVFVSHGITYKKLAVDRFGTILFVRIVLEIFCLNSAHTLLKSIPCLRCLGRR